MSKLSRVLLALVLTLMPLSGTTPVMAQGPNSAPSNLSLVAGRFVASRYAYPLISIISGGGAASTTYSITVSTGSIRLQDGRTIVPFGAGGTNTQGVTAGGLFPAIPITVGAGTVQETVTPTSVSGCYIGAPQGTASTCVITAAFTYAHGAGEVVGTGSYGMQEAINDAATNGGGIVEVDASENGKAGGAAAVSTEINTLAVVPNVAIEDTHLGVTRNWSGTPTGVSIAAGTTLTGQAACDGTHQFCSDASVAGSASWGSTVYGCFTYVDIFGNESPCTATASFTSVASMAIDMGLPAAKAGAVGWIPYLSLSGGSYALAYQIPPTATVCTTITLPNGIVACALTNSTYNLTGSTYGVDALFKGGAQIVIYPVTTAMDYPILATTPATITTQHPMTNSSVTYAYAPSNRVGTCAISPTNMVQVSAAGGINGSSATTVPNPMVSYSIPPGCFNYIGAEIRLKGKFTYTDGGDTSTHVYVSWDSNGTNTASVPTPLCNMLDTATGTSAAYNGTWDCTIRVLTTGATGTVLVNGYSAQALAAGATTLVRNTTDIAVAASGSVNLAGYGRLTVWFEGIGATNNPGAQGLESTLEVLN